MLFLPRVKNKERFEGQQNILQQEFIQQNEKKNNTKWDLDTDNSDYEHSKKKVRA